MISALFYITVVIGFAILGWVIVIFLKHTKDARLEKDDSIEDEKLNLEKIKSKVKVIEGVIENVENKLISELNITKVREETIYKLLDFYFAKQHLSKTDTSYAHLLSHLDIVDLLDYFATKRTRDLKYSLKRKDILYEPPLLKKSIEIKKPSTIQLN